MSKRFHPHSLGTQLLCVVLLSLLAAVTAFGVLFSLGSLLLDKTVYGDAFLVRLSDRQFVQLQEYVTREEIGKENLHRLNVWCSRGGRVYLTIFDSDDEMLYESPWAESARLEPDELDEEFDSLIRSDPLTLRDGAKVRALFFYYAGDAWFYSLIVVSALAAFLAFSSCFIGFVGRKLRCVSRLKSELDILAGGDLSYPVTIQGDDELSELAAGVEQMRRSILSHQEAEEQMRSANSRLVTAMSHDLRTPLTSLLGYLELMERGKYENDEQLRHFISRSREKALCIKEMADKLFEYFLVYSSEWEKPDLELADADELFRHFWSEYAFSLESSSFTVRFDFAPLDGRIRVNIDLLRRAFDNLYSNLLKYADPAQEIGIVCAQEGGLAVLRLENRVSAQRNAKESTNIGLNTCRRILQYHGGEFACQEADGMFRVRLSLPLIGKE